LLFFGDDCVLELSLFIVRAADGAQSVLKQPLESREDNGKGVYTPHASAARIIVIISGGVAVAALEKDIAQDASERAATLSRRSALAAAAELIAARARAAPSAAPAATSKENKSIS